MILPQKAPYTAPLGILICGGSTPFAGDALDNCVSITPESQNPQWTIERMVSVAKFEIAKFMMLIVVCSLRSASCPAW
jgi:hypothetical protein